LSSLVRTGQSSSFAADAARYEALISVLRDRVTARAFNSDYHMPREHIELVMDAAAQAPSGANAQPWQYVAVTNTVTKRLIAGQFAKEHARRAAANEAGRARRALHSLDYGAMEGAPGFIVVLLDPRMTWAFPGLMDGSELDQPYHANSERMLLQSVAASVMAAHQAATALGYQSWWVSALGFDDARAAIARDLAIPSDLRITDLFLFGPSLEPVTPRWKKNRDQILSWDKFDMDNFRTVEQIDEWIGELRGEPALPSSNAKQIKA
jgi:5,6-dimethylbenzimidazole synthase